MRLQAANAWFRGLRLGAALPLLLALAAQAGPGLNTDSPLGFFTNLASRLLQAELNRELTHIQVHPTNQYTPAVHRLLQVTANLYDATTNRYNLSPPYLPSVFRPIFRRQGNAVFISGYQEVHATTGWSDPVFALPLNLSNPVDVNNLPDGADSAVNVYGVPWIIGARKGFPNFNEFAMSSTFAMARKLEIQRITPSQKGMNGTMRMKYLLNLTNVLGIELWNSYSIDFPRDLEVAVQLDMAMVLTNDHGMVPYEFHMPEPIARVFSIPANTWSGYSTTNSFFIPLLTNVPFLPESTYLMATKTFSQDPNLPFENGQGFPYPRWGFSSTNRVRAIIRDTATGRIIDYVQLDALDGRRDLSEEVLTGGYSFDVSPTTARWREEMWKTNRPPSIFLPYQGITNQILASIGSYGNPPAPGTWENYGTFGVAAGETVQSVIEAFRLFYLGLPGNTNLVAQVPFTPIARYKQHLRWQANDPLAHSLTADLTYMDWSNGVQFVSLKLPLPVPTNLGYLNNRYRPWGGNPAYDPAYDANAYNLAIKDPLVSSSDRWLFPNAEPLSIPMLSHVHRGTPWQTIYLKANAIQDTTWRNWTGNYDADDAQHTQPLRDGLLVSLINSLINTNHPHRLVSVNEPNTNVLLATFDGIVALTNATPNGEPVVMTADSPQAAVFAEAIRVARANQPNQRFTNLESVLAIRELSVASPWLDLSSSTALRQRTSDEAYETVAAQFLERLRPDSVGFISQTNGVVKVQFTGFDDYPYAVESSSNLVNWLPVTTNSPTNGVLDFFPPAPGSGHQFYRSTLIP